MMTDGPTDRARSRSRRRPRIATTRRRGRENVKRQSHRDVVDDADDERRTTGREASGETSAEHAGMGAHARAIGKLASTALNASSARARACDRAFAMDRPKVERVARAGRDGATNARATHGDGRTRKARVMFLGTPDVARDVLKKIIDASNGKESMFEVTCVVSQPGRPRGRGRLSDAPAPSPVAELALERGIAKDRVLCPEKANEEGFLNTLRSLDIDLAVTAAYGNFLPQKFLDIPRLGTLNIHPSLLPQWRGAAPVQRALESGQAETGVSVAYTVLKMDAGPVLRQIKRPLTGDEKAPELLNELFETGVQALLDEFPSVFAGEAAARAIPQSEATLTHAAKVSPEEGDLDFKKQSARECHNKVRAFAGWPGTKATLKVKAGGDGAEIKDVVIKIITSRVSSEGNAAAARGVVELNKKALRVPCAGGEWLELLEVQPPGKKAMDASSFINGLGKGAIVCI